MAVGTAVLDFGVTPTDEASIVVTGQTSIASDSHVEAFVMRESNADNDLDDHEEAATIMRLVCGTIVAGTGFTIKAHTLHFLATGDFNLRFVWTPA